MTTTEEPGLLAPLFAQVRICLYSAGIQADRVDALAALSSIEQWTADAVRHVQDMAGETRCAKCGSDDVLVRWHEKRPSNRQAACRDSMSVLDYGKRPELKSEHLHYHCRRCQFDWTGPVLAALSVPADQEGEK